jgi:hypothetical protein
MTVIRVEVQAEMVGNWACSLYGWPMLLQPLHWSMHVLVQ